MAFGFGKKKKDDTVDDSAADNANVAEQTNADADGGKKDKKDKKEKKGFTADPKKARRFFEHAKTVADSGNFDYSIELYINGLRHSPDSMDYHELLHEVSRKRKLKGGKPAGMMETMKHNGGKGPLEKMLNAEFLWAKDPDNPKLAMTVMENAVKCELDEVAHWMGGHALVANRGAKKPDKNVFLQIRDVFQEMGDFNLAVEACQYAVKLDKSNMELIRELRDLQTEQAMLKAKYGGEEGFRGSVKDLKGQQELEEEDAIAKTDDAKMRSIQRAREAFDENPNDIDAIIKLARALVLPEEVKLENEAVEVLKKGYEVTKQFRLKVMIGDIRMKQFKRAIRELRAKIVEDPDNADLTDKLNQLRTQQIQFELKEYTERAAAYPTDMSLRYEMGRRQFVVEDYDSAIASFQEAQTDPKHRAQALYFLGASFAKREWYDESVDTFKRGIENHDIPDDTLGLNLRYELVNSLTALAGRDRNLEVAEEAAKRASEIAMANINYKDIRDKVDTLRKLIADIRQNG